MGQRDARGPAGARRRGERPGPRVLERRVARDRRREHAGPGGRDRPEGRHHPLRGEAGCPRPSATRTCGRTASRSASTSRTGRTARSCACSARSSTSSASAPTCPALVGGKRPALILLNDDDLAYAKVRLDPASLAVAQHGLSSVAAALPRTLLWTTIWDMTRDGEAAPSDFVRLVLDHLGARGLRGPARHPAEAGRRRGRGVRGPGRARARARDPRRRAAAPARGGAAGLRRAAAAREGVRAGGADGGAARAPRRPGRRRGRGPAARPRPALEAADRARRRAGGRGRRRSPRCSRPTTPPRAGSRRCWRRAAIQTAGGQGRRMGGDVRRHRPDERAAGVARARLRPGARPGAARTVRRAVLRPDRGRLVGALLRARGADRA